MDKNQFGCVSNRSTTLALLKLTHEWFKASDKSNNIIRILFVDFTKDFDLIDHNILLKKFVDYEFPPHITAWSLDFLTNRKQYVKIGNRCSMVVDTKAGTPQGTLAGPNDFKLLIDDLKFALDYVKYVDDTTVFSISSDPQDAMLQS